jgi:hypothetical protein
MPNTIRTRLSTVGCLRAGEPLTPARRSSVPADPRRARAGHRGRAAHFSFPKDVWAELKLQGRIEAHPVFPQAQGPAARRIDDESDVRDVIALLRLNYDRAVARHGRPTEPTAA